MSDPSDILNLIDSAVRDWETSPDAVRYNGPKPADPGPRPITAASLVLLGPPHVFIGDEEVTVTAIEFDTVPAPPLGCGTLLEHFGWSHGRMAG